MPFEWLKFGHVLTIIAALALAEGTILPTYLAGRRRDVEAIRQGIARGKMGEKIANPLALISILFGVGAALAGRIDLAASWLIATYVLLGVAISIGIFGGFRQRRRTPTYRYASSENSRSSFQSECRLHSDFTVVPARSQACRTSSGRARSTLRGVV